ncbi:MAG: sulfatase-like hydrolase/transferase, partial [Candidatus Brocadiae bacterium]|nr:sulfatase-like hydrolase/transferase [Candidatus Brocadiia bacterium]
RTGPAAEALGAEGVSFGRAYSTAGQTAQSFPGILLSNFFQSFGRSRCIPDHLAALPEVMCANGYYTVAYNAANPHVSHFYGYDRGFDEFYDFLAPENFDYLGGVFADNSPRRMLPATEREVRAIFEELQARPDIYDMVKALTGLDGLPLVCHIAQRRRFYPYDAADLVKGAIGTLLAGSDRRKQFYWLHFMDLHENITVPFSRLGGFSAVEQFLLNTCLASPMGQQVLRGNAEKYGQLYDSAVSYVDMNVEILRNFLADHGLLESSLICLTADHGQELLEGGVFGHGYDRLAEGVVHVPLIFGGGLAGRIDGSHGDRAVSTLDIAPTILDVCEIAEAPDTFLGSSLNDVRPRPIYGQTFYGGADNR